MKSLLLSFYILMLFSVVSCGEEVEVDYVEMATDVCDCFNEFETNISDETLEIILKADEDGVNILTAVGDHFADNPTSFIADNMAIQQASKRMNKVCLPKIKNENKELYNTESKDQFYLKLYKALGKNSKCKMAHAFMTIEYQMNRL